jgi:hypothetical protein
MHFIVKVFPEIIVKSPPVRKRFIKQLRDNLRRMLAPLETLSKEKRSFGEIAERHAQIIESFGVADDVVFIPLRSRGCSSASRFRADPPRMVRTSSPARSPTG